MTTLVQRLASARLNGGTVTVKPAEAPTDIAAAYAIQSEVASFLGPMSQAWKVGSTSKASQAKLGTDQPGSARVPTRYLFASDDEVPVFVDHDVWIEGEFALRLGADLPPRDAEYGIDEVIAAVDGVAPAIEVVGCRFADGISKSGRLRVTADGGANVALIIGEVISDWYRFDLPSHPVQLMVNGLEAAVGVGANALGGPVNVMVWLANEQRSKGGLQRGEIVSTGTCTGLVRAGPGDRLASVFGPIEAVEANLVAPQ